MTKMDEKIVDLVKIALEKGDSIWLLKLSTIFEKRAQFEKGMDELLESLPPKNENS